MADFHTLDPLTALFNIGERPEGMPFISAAFDPSSLEFLAQLRRSKSETLKIVIAEQGWPSSAREGDKTEAAAFLIALHADYDPSMQRLCHYHMLESYRKGETPAGYLAFMTDRILCNEDHPQRFGTQYREVVNGCFVPRPLEDPDRVDEWRDYAGLQESLSDYLQRINSGDQMGYRILLNGYAKELEDAKTSKIIPFPSRTDEPDAF